MFSQGSIAFVSMYASKSVLEGCKQKFLSEMKSQQK